MLQNLLDDDSSQDLGEEVPEYSLIQESTAIMDASDLLDDDSEYLGEELSEEDLNENSDENGEAQFIEVETGESFEDSNEDYDSDSEDSNINDDGKFLERLTCGGHQNVQSPLKEKELVTKDGGDSVSMKNLENPSKNSSEDSGVQKESPSMDLLEDASSTDHVENLEDSQNSDPIEELDLGGEKESAKMESVSNGNHQQKIVALNDVQKELLESPVKAQGETVSQTQSSQPPDLKEEGAASHSKSNIEALRESAKNIEDEKIKKVKEWYIAYDGKSMGPMNVENVLKKMDDCENPEFVYLWKQGFSDWQNLFDVPEISPFLGIGFRRHERIYIDGNIKIEYSGKNQSGKLETLSESGFGGIGFSGFRVGEMVKVTLELAYFGAPMEFVGTVRLMSNRGFIGVSFVKDNFVENINKIIEFVKSQTNQNTNAA